MKADLHKAITSTRLVGPLMTLLLLAALTPSSYAQDAQSDPCDMLRDDSLRVMLGSGLERKLVIQCGEMDQEKLQELEQDQRIFGHQGRRTASRLKEGRRPARAKRPRRHRKGRQGNAILVSDPTQDGVGTTTQSETSIVTGRGTVCAAWNDSGEFLQNNGFSGFGSSGNRGRTWTDHGSFPNGTAPFDTNFGDPSLAFSKRDGTFYYAALSTLGLSLWVSTDKCKSFSYVGPIHVGSGDDKELIAVDNNSNSPFFGRIYVGWTDFALVSDRNVVSFSDDGGLTWSLPFQLPGSGTAGQGMWPAVAPNGDVYFALLNRSFVIGGLQDQWIYKSTDGGVSFVQMTDIATGQLRPENVAASTSCDRQALNGDIRNLSSPQIAIHRDLKASAGYVIHAVYPYDSDGAGPDESNVFYRRSTDGALTWSPETQLNDDSTSTDQFFPALGVNKRKRKGVVVVSWYDRRLDPDDNLAFDRFAVVSVDSGLTWRPNIRVSDVSSPVATTNPNFDPIVRDCYHGDYDQVVVDNGRKAHVIWSGDQRVTGTGPNPDIYYNWIKVK